MKKVWAAKNADPDQLERLKMLRATLNISEELHQQLEEEIKQQSMEERSTFKISPSEINILIQESSTKRLKKKKHKDTQAHKEKLKDVKLKKILTMAKEKYLKDDYGEAIELLNQGSKLDPDNEDIKFYTKKVKIKLNKSKKGIRKLDKEEKKGLFEIRETIDEQTGVKIKEKITIPRSEHKKLVSKTAIPVSNLNGASLEPQITKLEEKIELNEPEKPVNKELDLQQENKEPESNENTIKSEPTKVVLEKPQKPKCISCNGTGQCYWCNGTGECDRCAGTGDYNDSACTMCNGSGKCNSCNGKGLCMWCRGKGTSTLMNTIYSKNE